MKEASFTNRIEIDGEEFRLDELSEEKRKQIAVFLSQRFMETAGFRKKDSES